MELRHEEDTTIWTMKSAELKALLMFAGKDPLRREMYGITLDGQRCAAMATDHRRIVAATVAPMGPIGGTTAVIPRPVLDRCYRFIDLESDHLRIVVGTDHTARIQILGSQTFVLEPIHVPEVKPLRWHDVINEEVDAAPFCSFLINPEFLFDLVHVANAAGLKQVKLRPSGGQYDPIVAEFEKNNGTTWKAMIAPMKE